VSGSGFANIGSGNSGTRNLLLVSNTTPVTRNTAGTFATYTLPGNSLQTNGDFLYVETSFTISGAANNVIAVQFAGSVPSPIAADFTTGGVTYSIVMSGVITRLDGSNVVGAGESFRQSVGATQTTTTITSAAFAANLSVNQDINIITTVTSGTITLNYYYITSYMATG